MKAEVIIYLMSYCLMHCFFAIHISIIVYNRIIVYSDQQADRGEDRSDPGIVRHAGRQTDAGDATGKAGEAAGRSTRPRTSATHATRASHCATGSELAGEEQKRQQPVRHEKIFTQTSVEHHRWQIVTRFFLRVETSVTRRTRINVPFCRSAFTWKIRIDRISIFLASRSTYKEFFLSAGKISP